MIRLPFERQHAIQHHHAKPPQHLQQVRSQWVTSHAMQGVFVMYSNENAYDSVSAIKRLTLDSESKARIN
jgi:hypothetical protein